VGICDGLGRFSPTGKQASELTCLAWGKVPAGAASATKKKKAKQVRIRSPSRAQGQRHASAAWLAEL